MRTRSFQIRSITTILRAILLVTFMTGLISFTEAAHAGVMEMSVGYSYNRQNYSLGNYAQTTRYTIGVAYHFSALSGIEWSFQQITDVTKITGIQDTTFNDRVYSLNWVQAFTDRTAMIQPFLKLGAGQLNRDASGVYAASGQVPPPLLDALTILLGGGLKVNITQTFAFRFDVVSYLQGFQIKTWSDNLGVTVGTSFYF